MAISICFATLTSNKANSNSQLLTRYACRSNGMEPQFQRGPSILGVTPSSNPI